MGRGPNDKRNSDMHAGMMNNSGENTGEISRKLRALYESVEKEEIPDRFLDLLEKLDKAEKSAGQDDKK